MNKSIIETKLAKAKKDKDNLTNYEWFDAYDREDGYQLGVLNGKITILEELLEEIDEV